MRAVAAAAAHPIVVRLDAAAAGSGDACAQALVGLGERGLACRYRSSPAGGQADSRRRDRMPGRAAPALSSAMAIETVSGFEEQGTAVCFAGADQGERESTCLPSGSSDS